MRLPEELEESYWQQVRAYEGAEQMPYVTGVERMWRKQGVREGLLAGIELGLELRFGGEGLRLLPEIYRIEDVDVLQAIHDGLRTAGTLKELRRIYQDYVFQPAGAKVELQPAIV